jgi:hypothetical protein
MPAGPGARDLSEFFTHVDGKPVSDTAQGAGAPRVQASDRDVLNLLTKSAKTLHLGAANYCCFTDPSRALCLKLAGTPNADGCWSTATVRLGGITGKRRIRDGNGYTPKG